MEFTSFQLVAIFFGSQDRSDTCLYISPDLSFLSVFQQVNDIGPLVQYNGVIEC